MEKSYDLILNMAGNPGLSLGNLKTVGLTADNTALESEEKYLNSQKIQNMAMFKDDMGNFSKTKFHDFYQTAKNVYNVMSSDQYTDDLAKKSRVYHRDNIFAPVDQRQKGPEINWIKQSNPYRNTQSIVRLGKTEDSPYTWDELAQKEKVLANPVEATRPDGTIDESKAKWQDAPNDSWFSNFWETRVAAQWDEDGEHLNPVTGEKETHKKGDLKLNSSGNFYYENLDGRDVYGRRVLNKMNTLTTDGSEWNKYDFFDSDGKDKSVGGTVMKNAALVGSMFIPYVGPAVTFLGLAGQTAGLLGTLGKMVSESTGAFGSLHNTFSELEGFSKSISRQGAVSEYSQQHTWTMENLIGLVGDVMAQFKEQRFLFEKAPLIFKNKYGIVNNGNYQSKLAQIEADLAKLDQSKIDDLVKSGKNIIDLQRAARELSLIRQARATSELDSYVKGYNKIGELLSKTYMTAITTGDTYGEAKLQGATPVEAALLTLGYSAGEAAILNTGIGEWLFPELRYEKLHQKAIADALVKVKKETEKAALELVPGSVKRAEEAAKKNLAKKIFNIGKNTAKDLYTGYKSTGDKTIKAAFANALGEGTEEVSEEFLADFSKACFNTIEWLGGGDTHLEAFDNGDWEKILNRYSMNFVGGFIGGGAAGFSLDNMRNMKKLDHMEFDQAVQELIYMVRNGQTQDFLKTVDEMTLGDKNLSARHFTKEDDNYVWDQGTSEDNQDKAAKDAIRAQIKLFDDVLSAEGIKMSDDSFLSKQTDLLPDIKFGLLQRSATAGRYLQEFNSLGAKLIQANAMLLAEKGKVTSSETENNTPANAQVDIAENQKQLLQQQINDIQTKLQTATDEEQVALKESLNQLRAQLGSQQNSGSKIQNIERELKELRQQKEALLDGTRAPEFIQDALFEMTTLINDSFIKPSFIRFAEYKTKKNFNEISENELGLLQKEWENWNEMDRAEQVHNAAEIFKNVLLNANPIIAQNVAKYEMLSKTQDLLNLQEILNKWYEKFQDIQGLKNPEQWLQQIIGGLGSMYTNLGLQFNDSAFRNTFSQVINEENNISNEFQTKLNDLRDRIAQVELDTSLSPEEKAEKEAELGEERLALETEYTEKGNANYEKKKSLVAEQITKSIDDLVAPYMKQGFANFEIKNAIENIIKTTSRILTQEINQSGYNEVKSRLGSARNLSEDEQKELDTAVEFLNSRYENIRRLEEIRQKFNQLNSSPIEEILDKFTTAIGSDNKISQLMRDLSQIFEGTNGDISKFSMNKSMGEQITEAINLIDLLRSAIEAGKIDDGNLDNAYGYNKVLNEINHKVGNQKWVDLFEITADTANVLIQDLNLIKNKLQFYKNLYSVASGQKLAVQRKVALNKDYLFFNRLNSFVAALPPDDEDWKGVKELKSLLESLEVLNANGEKRNLNISKEDQDKLEEEVLKMEDAVYDFFKKNEKSLKSSKKLGKLLRENFDVFKVPNELLTETTEVIDDNSFIWWLATRAAVKSTDFHKEYINAIDPTIAPIPSQELAIYENFASVANKDLFKQFYYGFRQAIKEQWSTFDEDKRREVIDRQNINFSEAKKWSDYGAAIEEVKDYPFINLIVPKYSSIVFTEGIPGSGKSTGVYKTTIKMIQNNEELRNAGILDNVLFIYAAGSASEEDQKAAAENAKKSITNLGLDPTKTRAVGLEEGMRQIVNREPLKEATDSTNDDRLYDIPDADYEMTSQGEYRSCRKLEAVSKPYSLIIIDEMTNINMFDLDDLNRYAEQNGLMILGAGDTDQSGVSGNFTVKKDGTIFGNRGAKLPVNLFNVNFIRTPKLGVSMRTTNSQKTLNLSTAQLWASGIENDLTLHYFEDETGIYGDKYFDKNVSSVSDVEESIKLMISTLSPGEKIGFVYDPDNSDLYDLIKNNYSEYVEFLPGTTSQGKEGQYYIIEINESNPNLTNDLYTAITRSSQGSIVFTDAYVQKQQDPETHLENFSENAIKLYADQRRESLTRLTESGNPVHYTAPKKKAAPTPEPEPTPEPTPTPEPPTGPGTSGPTATGTTPPAPSPTATGITSAFDSMAEGAKEAAFRKAMEDLYNNKEFTFTKAESIELARKNYWWLDEIKNADGSVTFRVPNGFKENFLLDPDFKNMSEDAFHAEIEAMQNFLETYPNGTYESKNLFFGTVAEYFYKNDFDFNYDSVSKEYSISNRIEPLNFANVKNINGQEITIKPGDFIVDVRQDKTTGLNEGHHVYPMSVSDICQQAGITYVKFDGYDTWTRIDENSFVNSLANVQDALDFAQSDEAKKYYKEDKPEDIDPIDEQLEPTVEEVVEETTLINPDPTDISTLCQADKPEVFNAFGYTFNTFESGVYVENDTIQFFPNNEHRLDSVNGLVKLDKKAGKPIRSLNEYLNIIGRLRTAIFTISDKAELNKEIEKILNEEFGISNISTIFGLVSHAKQTQNGLSSSTGEYTRAQRHEDEELEFVNSNDVDSKKVQRKTISIEIASEGEDVLELPLISLPNPITLINQGLTDVKQTITDVEQLRNVSTNNRGLRHLIYVYLNITDDSFIKIDDNNWTVANTFTNLGVQPIGNKRGFDYVANHNQKLNPEFIDISELAKNPDIKISRLMYSKSSTMFDENGNELPIKIKPGHPFVLVGNDPENMFFESEMLRILKRDLNDYGEPRNVKIVYVLPPQIGVADYAKNLAERYAKTANLHDDVGNIDSAYQIIKDLFREDGLDDFINQLKIDTKSATTGNIVESIKKTLEDLSQYEGEELISKLKETSSLVGFGNVPNHVAFKTILAQIYYPNIRSSIRGEKNAIGNLHTDNMKLVEERLSNDRRSVFFKANRKTNGIEWETFYELSQNDDWTITDAQGNKRSYQISGVLTEPILQANITKLLSDIISRRHEKDRGNKHTKAYNDTLDYIHRRSVNPNFDLNIANLLKTVKNKTGLDILPSDIEGDYKKYVVNQINKNTDNIAFIINGQVQIFNKWKSDKIITDSEGIEITELQLDREGNSFAFVKVDNETYQLNYMSDSKGKTIIELIPQTAPQTPNTSVNKELTSKEFDDIHKEILTLVQSTSDKFTKMILKKLSKLTDSKEFETQLTNMYSGSSDFRGALLSYGISEDNVNRLMEMLENKSTDDNKPQDACNVINTLKINLI